MIVNLQHSFVKTKYTLLLDLLGEVDNFDDFRSNISNWSRQQTVCIEERNKIVGDTFEVFVEMFLNAFGSNFFINDYKPATKVDNGVDGHGTNHNNDVITVQCKYKSNPTEMIHFIKDSIDKFWSQSIDMIEVGGYDVNHRDKRTKKMFIITSCCGINVPSFQGKQDYVEVIHIDDIRKLVGQNTTKISSNQVFWDDFRNSVKVIQQHYEQVVAQTRPSPKQLRPMQNHAHNAMIEHNKGIILHPTGTGKSLIQTHAIFDSIKKHTYGNTGIYVLVSPVIILNNQLLSELEDYFYTRGTDLHQYQRILVNSDKLFSKALENKFADKYGDKYRKSITTTLPGEIRSVICNAKREGIPTIISSTYDSFERIVDAVKDTPYKIDIVLFDEAHHLVEKSNEKFTSDFQQYYNSCFFFTATLEVREGKEANLCMTNETRFGKIISEYKNIQAVMDREIVKPGVHLLYINQNDVTDDLQATVSSIKHCFVKHSNILMSSSENRLDAKILISCKSIENIEEVITEQSLNGFVKENSIYVFYVSSNSEVCGYYDPNTNMWYKNLTKDSCMDKFRTLSDLEKAMVLHCDMLTEGIDVPNITGIMPLRNLDIRKFLQTLGRATRLLKIDREYIYQNNNDIVESNLVKRRAWVMVPVYDVESSDRCSKFKDILRHLKQWDYKPEDLKEDFEYTSSNDGDDEIELPTDLKDQLIKDINRAQHLLDADIESELAQRLEEECLKEYNSFVRSGRTLVEYCKSLEIVPVDKFIDFVVAQETETSRKGFGKRFVVNTIPFTKPELINEIFSKVEPIQNNTLNSKICVIYTAEMAISLKGKGFNNVWLYTAEYDTLMEDLSRKYDIQYIHNEQRLREMKFDVVIGNPPYQETMNDGSRKSKNSNLWSEFLSFSVQTLVVENGHVCLITPPSWMSPNSNVHHIFHENLVKYINVGECKKHFPGVGSQFSYFCIQKSSPDGQPTETTCGYNNKVEHGSINITPEVLFFPTILTATSMSIFKKTCFSRNDKLDVRNICEVHTSSKGKKFELQESESFLYPTYYSPSKIVYAIKKTSNFDMKKVIFSEPGYVRAQYDNGHMGTASSGMFIPVSTPNEGNNLVELLHSKLYQFITTIAKWSGFNIQKVLKSLPTVDLSKTWANEDLYAYFNLTQEEIKLIEDTVQ